MGWMQGVKAGQKGWIIRSGRRHLFSDEVIIGDIIAETGCSYDSAKKELEKYQDTQLPGKEIQMKI